MFYREFNGINSFLVGMSQLLLEKGIERKTRGFKCFELPSPVLIKITNPTARIITIPVRNWNFTLPYVESLWLASGRNDIKMVAHYVNKMASFSDDQVTMRGGYGPRFRYFNGIANDYNHGFMSNQQLDSLTTIEIDQFEYIEKSFQKDPYTRQAIITIGDPAKDCFKEEHVLKETKDYPCTRDLQFIRNNNRLDLIVHMRSNDFMWGASGVNIFNFTFIQEYFAKILGLEIGDYYHIANNFHYYEDQKEKVIALAETTSYTDAPFLYSKSFKTLSEFDEMLLAFQKYEYELREGQKNILIDFSDDFFNDWAKVLFQFKNKSNKNIKYVNPILDEVSKRKINSVEKRNNRQQLMESFAIGHNNEKIFWRQYI